MAGTRLAKGTKMDSFTERPSCPKCGHSYLDWEWREHQEGGPNMLGFDIPHVPEHIKLTCRRCSYSWQMSPLTLEPRIQFQPSR